MSLARLPVTKVEDFVRQQKYQSSFKEFYQNNQIESEVEINYNNVTWRDEDENN